MKNNEHNQEFDETFNERFSDFQFNPDPEFFDRIQAEMKHNEFDREVKGRFDEFSVTPADKVWESVKPNLPLHLGLRIQLQRLSRVAAVVLFAMTGFYLYQIQQDRTTLAGNELAIPAKENIVPAAKTDFVFEVPESVPVTEMEDDKAAKKVRKKKKSNKKKVSDYLALILDEDDDFDALIDHQKIKETLQPVEELSHKFMTASALAPLPRAKRYSLANTEDIELNINIPLQVVEPHEVDDLLRLYDETQRGERD